MHHIYHTEALILASKSFGEAGKRYFLLTRDLGMILATAQGVRKMSSKLRFILQDYSYIKVDLVRGKDIWRVTSASKTNELENIITKKSALRIFASLSVLLRRLLQGEDPNPTLFEDLVLGLKMLEKAETRDEMENIEAIVVLRLLHNLGYIGGQDSLEGVIRSPLGNDTLFEAAKNRANILKQINKALRETHL